MKYFLTKILIFITILFLLDKVLFIATEYIADSQYDKRLEQLITKNINAELIILGSSRAARDVLAEELEVKLGATVFNLGYPGSNLEFHVYLLEKIIEHSPSTNKIILVVDDLYELIDSNLGFRNDVLYPLVKYSEINEEIVQRDGKSLLLSKLIYSYRIRENFPKILFRKKPGSTALIEKSGSMPISSKSITWDSLEYADDLTNFSTEMESSFLKNEFLRFMEICEKNKIKILFVFPPNYKNLNNSFVKHLEQIIDNKFPIYTYDQSNIIYKDKKYFYDVSHLNTKGAGIFTAELAEFIDETGF